MSLVKTSWLVLLCWVQLCYACQLSVKFLKTPHAFSKNNSATFVFQALVDGNITCSSCKINCMLDCHPALDCRSGKIFYSGLQDGAHKFMACATGVGEVSCATYNWTVDRRNESVDVRPRLPEKLLQLDNQTRMVRATNKYDELKVYLYFSEPILNSSAEVLSSLKTSQGQLLPIDGGSLGNRRFGFQVANMSGVGVAIVTVAIDSNSIISRQGTPISPIAPVTFLYDTERPQVRLNTTSDMRTREQSFLISIKFMEPVFGFNSSCILISGGHLLSFQETSRSKYIAHVQADMDTISVSIPENITEDIAGNKNLASNVLEVRHYSVPAISSVTSWVSTAVFLGTAFTAGLLTISTVSLQSQGAFSRSSPSLTSDPNRNLFRTASYIQVFALSRWLPVILPIEYHECVRGLQWIIPYFPLPWERAGPHSQARRNAIFKTMQLIQEGLSKAGAGKGLPLTAREYRSLFETPEAEDIEDSQHSNGWIHFHRIMFWLAVIDGGLILLHAFLNLMLKFRKATERTRGFGALTFPRFELFLFTLALPSICKAARHLVKDYFKHRGGAEPSVIIGILLLCLIFALVLALFLFLSIGGIHGKLLQYKEIHQEGQKSNWYQELIRVTLGPGKQGQWTWKNQPDSVYLTMLGPLFEDFRGPPMSQISGSNPVKTQGDPVIASENVTQDAKAPRIQKLLGILRIHYTHVETVKRLALGIISGSYSGNQTSKTPVMFMLCITSFQLFFVVLKKPFIKKNVQLVEIISLSCQVGMFASSLVFLENKLSEASETKLGNFMTILFLVGFKSQMANEWYALYRQTKRLDQKQKSFSTCSKMATFGILSMFLPQNSMKRVKTKLLMNQFEGGDTGNAAEVLPGDQNGSPDNANEVLPGDQNGSPDNATEVLPGDQNASSGNAKATFNGDRRRTPNDPSSSRTKKSGFWGTKRSARSSSPSDAKPEKRERIESLMKQFEGGDTDNAAGFLSGD